MKLSLSEQESDLLRRLISEYLELLDSPPDPNDNARTRLFPAASLDDPEVADQFRELSVLDLDAHKRRTAETAAETLGSSKDLSEEELEAWLVLLTDLRLIIGERQGVTEETMEKIPDPEDPAEWPLALLHYLGALQENLVEQANR